MFERALKRYREINKKLPPENSLFVRVCVLATVLTGTFAVILQGYFAPATNILAPTGIIVGFVFSWFNRDKLNIGLKIGLSFALLGVTIWFFYEIVAVPYDTRVPLAELFLWIQTLHSFDVPARRDLQFSLVSALVLMAMAGTLALDMTYIIFLAVFMVFGLLSLFGMHLSELDVRIGRFKRDAPGGRIAIWAIVIAVLLSLVSATIYVVTPRLPGMRVQSLPFSVEKLASTAFHGGLLGGTRVNLNERLPMSRATFSGQAYPGFNQNLDLRLRGKLSQDLMMRVKETHVSYHRGQVFVTYTGKGWKPPPERPKAVVHKGQPPILLPALDVEQSISATEIIASYYVEADQPNIAFAPYQANALYFPSAAIWIDSESALTSSFPLSSGVIYSVVSRYAQPDADQLRRIPAVYRNQDFSRYLALPKMPARDVTLAMKMVAGATRPYDKLKAIEAGLSKRCAYSLNAPFQPDDRDAVDFFLFDSRRGSCDQFASAFVVLARLNGIPARVVTGYAPGDYNPFTGYYEIRAEHAHAWAEVYFPVYGWVTFDPTPGSQVIEDTGFQRTFVFAALADYLKKSFPGQLQSIKRVIAALRAGTASSYARAISALALAGVFFYAGLTAFSRLRRKVVPAGFEPPERYGTAVDEAYRAMCELFAGLGRPRSLNATPAEYAYFLKDEIKCPEIDILTGLFEATFYGARPVSADEEAAAARALAAISEKLKKPSDTC